VPHYFIDTLELEEECSAGRYEREALELITGDLADEPIIILTGGSGLYVKALLEGLDEIPHNPDVRDQLNQVFEKEGLPKLLTRLANLDPDCHGRIDQHNPHRVIRALEVCISTGQTYSSFLNRPKAERPFDSLLIGLRRDRDELKERIAQRFDIMMNDGWLAEARNVHDQRHLNSLNTVGYKELFAFLDGQMDEEIVRELIVRETQRFAKRQMTWFNKMSDILWLDLPDAEIVEKVRLLTDKSLEAKGLT